MGGNGQTPRLPICRRQAHGRVGDAGELQLIHFTLRIRDRARTAWAAVKLKLTAVNQVPMLVILVFNTLFLIWVILVRNSRLLWAKKLPELVYINIHVCMFSNMVHFNLVFNQDCHSHLVFNPESHSQAIFNPDCDFQAIFKSDYHSHHVLNKECYFKLFSTQIVILTLFSTRIIIFTLFSTLNIIVTLFSTQIIFLTLSSTQIVILKLRQKAVTAVDHDRRHWKAAKVTFYHFFHYSERGQTSEENNEN